MKKPHSEAVPELMQGWNDEANFFKKKVEKTVNVLSSGYLFKVYDVKGENYMLNQLKPLLFVIRLLFRLPYIIDSRGRLTLQWFSVWTFYTAFGYLIQVFFTLELILSLYGSITVESDFFDIVKIAVNIMLVMNLLFVPLSALMEWKAYCIYLNQWIELQVDFEDITGKPFYTQMNLLIKISVGLIVLQSYVTVYMGTNALIQVFWYHKYVYMLFFLAFPMQLFLWVVCQYESGRMATLLKQHIIEVSTLTDSWRGQPLNNPRHAFRMRMLWLRLVYAVKLYGNASFTIIFLLAISGIVFLSGTYVILSGLIKGDPRANDLVGPVIISVFILVVICESSHQTTVQVGNDICEALVNLKSASMNQETTSEVERLLRIAAFNSPTVSLAGLITVSRSTLVSISKNVITYLIVLIQFQLTNDEEQAELARQMILTATTSGTTLTK